MTAACSGATTSPHISYIVGSVPNLRTVRRRSIGYNQQTFFIRLGKRVRELRKEHGHSQEDMILYGFSARHWQQIEAGRPITVSTLLRICAAFGVSVDSLVRGLDGGI